MSRQRCCGRIDEEPVCQEFLPARGAGGGEVVLLFAEVEALRLKDLEGFDQETCGEKMGLSRPTFQRLLQSARKKVSAAIVGGKIIKITGGNYQMNNRLFECVDCSHQWEEAPCTAGGKHGYEISCPKCGSMRKVKLQDGVRHACGGHGGEAGHAGGCCSHK